MKAFEEAIVRNADMVEFDLRRTSDGVIVLFHNPDFLNPTGQRTLVSESTFAELSEFARDKGFSIAVFEEVLSCFGDRIAMDIEIKVSGFEDDVARMLKADPPAFEPVISSFKPEVINRIKVLDSSLRVGLVIGSDRFKSVSFLARPFIKMLLEHSEYDSIHLHRSLFSQRVTRSLLDAGLMVYAWTVNDPDEIRDFARQGIKGIISDRPDIVHQIRLETEGTESLPIGGIPGRTR